MSSTQVVAVATKNKKAVAISIFLKGIQMKVMDGDWYETPYGLLRVAKVMKSALICWMYLPHMRIEEVILCTDQMAEWKLLGRRKFQPGSRPKKRRQ